MIQKNQMEILELKNVITKIKNSISGLNLKMQGIEERITELPNRTIEITQFGQQRENRLKKRINRASGIFGTVTKDLILVSSESRREKRNRSEHKRYAKK